VAPRLAEALVWNHADGACWLRRQSPWTRRDGRSTMPSTPWSGSTP